MNFGKGMEFAGQNHTLQSMIWSDFLGQVMEMMLGAQWFDGIAEAKKYSLFHGEA